MKNGNCIPHITHYYVCLNQLKRNQMIKYNKKNQQYLNVINQIGIRDSLAFSSLSHLFPPYSYGYSQSALLLAHSQTACDAGYLAKI